MARPKPEQEKCVVSVQVDATLRMKLERIAVMQYGGKFAEVMREFLAAGIRQHEEQFGVIKPSRVSGTRPKGGAAIT